MAKSCIHSTAQGDVIFDGRKCAFLPKSKTLLVGDLHFEKASFLQFNGHAPLPAYDTDDTFLRLTAIVKDYAPAQIVVLGDSFHDEGAGERLSPAHFDKINALTQSVTKFTWILGNHDPSIPKGLHGDQQDHLSVDGFLLTHLPIDTPDNEINICGHLHPKLKFKYKRRSFTHPYFAAGDNRIIMPSFGTYTGGLYVSDPAIADTLFGTHSYYTAAQDDIFRIT